MARGSGSSGGSYSYRQWAAAERAAQKEREQRQRQAEKDRQTAEAVARDEEAVEKTAAIERRVAELEGLLRAALGRNPVIRFGSLKITAAVQPLNLGPLAKPVPVPQWADFDQHRRVQRARRHHRPGHRPQHPASADHNARHEGATLGIMVTTSGYGPGSEDFANGKPLHLIDGPGLISVCQEHGIPARILGLGTRKRRS